MHLTATGNALFSKTQQRVLGLLFGAPEQRYYTNEIVRLADMGRGTVELFIAAEKLAYGEVMLPLNEASRLAGRAIKPSIYSRQHLRRELLKSNAFLNRVFRHPKLWVVGDDKALGELRRLARS